MSLYKLLLRTFLRLSVVGGLLPCYLQIDFANLNHSRNNFKLFSIFFPLTWWFTILLTAHFGYVALVINELVFFILDRLAENSEISLMMIIISVISDITLVVISFVPRLLVFRVTQLRSALISIGEFDQQFNKNYHKMCSTNTRLFTGALIIIAWVIINILLKKDTPADLAMPNISSNIFEFYNIHKSTTTKLTKRSFDGPI